MDKINRYFLQAHIPLVGTGDTFLIPVPISGWLATIWLTNEIAVTSAVGNCVFSTVTAAGVATAIVGGDITVAIEGALFTHELVVTEPGAIPVATARVTKGGSIRGIMDADSTSAGPGFVLLEITI